MEPLKLEWAGKTYQIPQRQMMAAILAVEDIITLGALAAAAQRNDIPMARVAKAYAAALRVAGADVDAYDVYRHTFGDSRPLEVVNSILALMIPPEALNAAPPDASLGNVGSTAAPNGSNKPSKPPSEASGAPSESSGV